MSCPCGSGQPYDACCGPIIAGERNALTAEELMRARYTAYARVETDFLATSLHPSARDEHDAEAVREWAEQSEWHGLEILEVTEGGEDDAEGHVQFAAEYTFEGEQKRHHEDALFLKEDGKWFFLQGQPVRVKPFVREAPKVGRNDPCPCGSGKKHKKCCGAA
jgi:SEC-C motif-containing protein